MEREVVTPYGRLDLVIRDPNLGVLCVEDSELLREGCRSYHKAQFAVMQFRREAQEAIRSAVDDRIDDIAAAMKLDKAEISEGLTPYADPANSEAGSGPPQALNFQKRKPPNPPVHVAHLREGQHVHA